MELLMSSSSTGPHLAILSNFENGCITVHRAQSIHNRLATVPLYFCVHSVQQERFHPRSNNHCAKKISDLKNLKYTPMSSSLTAVMQITRHTSSALDDKRMSVVQLSI
ncbi:hypothetical protein T01_2143 [Trichinella spiralis]|uniref:Uncharacterized protein n=1 Tax=Trichinella spiralis TaxID=6334 RepID=A0A0V1B7S5_TRISP|nr:hypothetical protein T01_2143 [Trichinella spiralis]